MRDEKYNLTNEEQSGVLGLLQEEVTTACNCQNDDMYFTDGQEKPSCDDDTFKSTDEEIIGYVATMKAIEEAITEYEISK